MRYLTTLQKTFFDASLWVLVLSNSITIYFAVVEHWSLATVMWVYWFQSVIIGVFTFLKILRLRDSSFAAVSVRNEAGELVEATAEYKRIFFAVFFTAHYGLFHLVYALLLLSGALSPYADGSQQVDTSSAYLAIATFFFSHLFSFLYNAKSDTPGKVGTFFLTPYARILPMHTIVLVSILFTGPALIVFLILKTIADSTAHSLGNNTSQ